MHERCFPAAQAQRLEDPARLKWLPPTEALKAIDIQPGQTIADVGAGTGYFTVSIAQMAGADGRVYAVDAQEEMLQWVAQKIEANALESINLVHADAAATTLPGASCDLFFIANVWHELDDRQAVLREAKRVLKPSGRIAILDWRPDVERVVGPPLEHRLSVEIAVNDLRQGAFHNMTAEHIGQYSWLVLAER